VNIALIFSCPKYRHR